MLVRNLKNFDLMKKNANDVVNHGQSMKFDGFFKPANIRFFLA